MLLLACGCAAAAWSALVGWLPACHGFVLPCADGVMAACLLDGTPAMRLLALIAPFVVTVNMLFARQMHGALREAASW